MDRIRYTSTQSSCRSPPSSEAGTFKRKYLLIVTKDLYVDLKRWDQSNSLSQITRRCVLLLNLKGSDDLSIRGDCSPQSQECLKWKELGQCKAR